jgi:hypothetical protein
VAGGVDGPMVVLIGYAISESKMAVAEFIDASLSSAVVANP